MKVFNTYSIASSTILLISVIPYTLTSAFTPLKTATNYSILKATSTSFDPLNLIDNDEKSSLSVTSPSVSSDPLQNGIGIRSLVSTSALLFLCPIVALAGMFIIKASKYIITDNRLVFLCSSFIIFSKRRFNTIKIFWCLIQRKLKTMNTERLVLQ